MVETIEDDTMDKITIKEKNVFIKAKTITLGNDVSFGNDIDIDIKGDFVLGDRSSIGNDTEIRGNNIIIGCDLFNSHGLRIGGGGRQHPNANLTIGDRCTIHNNFINVCEGVIIGNDVGLSPDVAILTHGYWLSVLEGFPAKFSGVTIGDGAIIGYRSLIMMGVNIGKMCVIGANSVVTKDTKPRHIYAGNPAKLIRRVTRADEFDDNRKKSMLDHIIKEYKKIAEFHGIKPNIRIDYPVVIVNGCVFNVENLEFDGKEDEETDDFRDYVRKWGLRFYSKRPFKSVWK